MSLPGRYFNCNSTASNISPGPPLEIFSTRVATRDISQNIYLWIFSTRQGMRYFIKQIYFAFPSTRLSMSDICVGSPPPTRKSSRVEIHRVLRHLYFNQNISWSRVTPSIQSRHVSYHCFPFYVFVHELQALILVSL